MFVVEVMVQVGTWVWDVYGDKKRASDIFRRREHDQRTSLNGFTTEQEWVDEHLHLRRQRLAPANSLSPRLVMRSL